MPREDLITLILAARTKDECDVARAALKAFMTEHPDDVGVLAAGEQLYMIATALDL